MTFSNFEKYAAGKINNHTSEVDAEALWGDILPHIQKSNNRRRRIIWFFFFGILASFAATYILTNSDNSNSGKETTALSSVNLMEESKDSKKTNSTEKEIATILSSKSIAENKVEQIAQNTATKSVQTHLIEKNYQIKNQLKKYKAVNNKQSQTKISVPIINSSITNSAETQMVLGKEEAEPSIDSNEGKPKVEKSTITVNNEAIPSDSSYSKILIGENIIAKAFESEEESPVKIIENAIAEEEDDYRSGNKFKLKYGIGFYGGLSSSFTSLKDKSLMNFDYLQLRLQTEEQLETIQLGIEAIAKSEIGVYFKSGLQYSRIARKFSLNSSIESIDSIYGILKIYVNNNTNDTIFEYGQVPVITTTTYNKITYNYFTLVDVPVLLGYTYNNESWSFGVEAGALINISTKTKGEIMGSLDEIYDLSEDKLNWFKDNVGVSFTASVSAAYQLNDNFQIYLAPTARLESVFSTKANPTQQKHGSLGVNIGARYFIGL